MIGLAVVASWLAIGAVIGMIVTTETINEAMEMQ